MEFSDAVRRRRMVRNYDPARAVSREQLNALLELGIRAPSAGFTQGWHFVVLDDADARAKFWTATTDPDDEPDRWLRGLQSAPSLILCLSDKQAYLDRYAAPDKGWSDRDEQRWPVPYWDIDTGMAAMVILLAAVDSGLSACFFGVPPEAHTAVRETFGLDSGLGLVGVISVGYGADDVKSPSLKRGRRPLTEVVSYNP